MNSSRESSPAAWANSRWRTLPLPGTWPSTFTLYGGSANTTCANSSFIKMSKATSEVASPQ